jgi:hypothetical protein
MINGTVTVADGLYPLRAVKVADKAMLDRHWPFLRHKLLLIRARVERPSWAEFYRFRKDPAAIVSRMRARWIPEQVRFAVLRGLVGNSPSSTEMFFFVEGQNEIVRGFIITTCDPDPFTQVPMDLFVWLGWTDTPGLLERADPLVDALARERGCSGVEFMSSRATFMRRLSNIGYRMKFMILRKELEEQ